MSPPAAASARSTRALRRTCLSRIRGQAHHALAPILSCQKANQPPRRCFKPFEDVLFHMQLALLRPKRKFMLSVRIQMGIVRNDSLLQGETLHHNEPRHPHGARAGCAVVHGHGAAAGDALPAPAWQRARPGEWAHRCRRNTRGHPRGPRPRGPSAGVGSHLGNQGIHQSPACREPKRIFPDRRPHR